MLVPSPLSLPEYPKGRLLFKILFKLCLTWETSDHVLWVRYPSSVWYCLLQLLPPPPTHFPFPPPGVVSSLRAGVAGWGVNFYFNIFKTKMFWFCVEGPQNLLNQRTLQKKLENRTLSRKGKLNLLLICLFSLAYFYLILICIYM